MEKTAKERIIFSLITGVIIFMALCVVHKLFIGKEDWLSYSIIWSIAWTMGLLISKTIVETSPSDETIWTILLVEIGIIIMVFILVAFVLGVVLETANYKRYIIDVMVSFTLAMLTSIRKKHN